MQTQLVGGVDHWLVGAVLGNWEFTSGASSDADGDEAIFLDLAKLHNRGKNGFLVYRGVHSIILDVAGTTEFPTTMYKLMQNFSQYTAQRSSTDGLFDHELSNNTSLHGNNSLVSMHSALTLYECVPKPQKWQCMDGLSGMQLWCQAKWGARKSSARLHTSWTFVLGVPCFLFGF